MVNLRQDALDYAIRQITWIGVSGLQYKWSKFFTILNSPKAKKKFGKYFLDYVRFFYYNNSFFVIGICLYVIFRKQKQYAF